MDAAPALDTITVQLRVLIGETVAERTWTDDNRGPLDTARAGGSARPPGHNPDDPRLCLRLYIGGTLADETWLDASDPVEGQRLADITTAIHSAGVDAAREAGVPWLIEVYDPALPPDVAYYRVGSDPAGMVCPIPIITSTAWERDA